MSTDTRAPTRREFLAASGAIAVTGLSVRARPQPDAKLASDAHRGACLICSANGLAAVDRAWELNRGGTYLLDSIVQGIKLVEDDPNDMSVGYGGLPNEDGVVQLDASVMDGPLHRAGSVGALENIKNPAAVALLVLRRTDHVMLVGAGALRFARAMGFQEENLLTEEAREAWLKWKANLHHDDDWLDDDQVLGAPMRTSRATPHDVEGPNPAAIVPDSVIPWTTGTIHMSGLDEQGRMGACTSTSGLSYKLSGRLGDSPIVGAGMYCDNAIGSAGGTGRGEAVIQVCGAFSIVEHMDRGLSPTDACLAVAKRIADRTREKRLLDAKGRPAFNVTFYALRKDGAYGSASILPGSTFAVRTGADKARIEKSASLFE